MARKRGKDNKLRNNTALFLAAFGFLGAILFISPNLTGHAIAGLSSRTSGWLTFFFVVIGMIGISWLLRERKREKRR